MNYKNTLYWDEVSDIAEKLLWGIGWSNDIKMLWAEKAWVGIVNNGLADYHNENERHNVYIRLISVVVLYGEFCAIAMEESFSPDFNEWMAEMELSPFRIGQLVGANFHVEESDDYDLIQSAITLLVEQTKGEVVVALSKEFGDRNILFVGLWLTHENLIGDFDEEIEDDEENYGSEKVSEEKELLNLLGFEKLISDNADYVLNYETTLNKMEAYSWLNEY